MAATIIADSGSTKCEWCLINDGTKQKIITTGISPYFLNQEQIIELLKKELPPDFLTTQIDIVYFYGSGLGSTDNRQILENVLKIIFGTARNIEVETDLLAAARATCKNEKGIACILGTGCNSCYYDGKKIISNSPGLGYILGDEGSGAYLGKKVIQYFLYNTFDEDLKLRFQKHFKMDGNEILHHVYKMPQPNKFLASFTMFLAENRRHYMIENIIEDGLNDFFFTHLNKYGESWLYPIHFVGSVAYGFRDVIKELCNLYKFEAGQILQKPMDGLIKFHASVL